MRDCFVKIHKMPPTLQISEKYVKINEELMIGEIQDKENIHSDQEEECSKSVDEEEIDVETVSEEQSTIEEEPVSPPPCNPEEAPTLLQCLSKTIEEIATEVVDENRAQISVSPLLKEDDIPKTVFKPSSSSSSRVPSLIPLTVSEIDETESKLASQSLHMSGGGVYTTDSFFYSQNLLSPQSRVQSKSRTSVIKRNPSPGGDRVNKRNSSPRLSSEHKIQEDSKSELDNLLDFYQTTTLTPSRQTAICRIPQATIKFSDSLEITPIKILPIELTSEPDRVNKVSHTEMESYKRKHESEDNATKKFRTNELIIEKIPRTSTEETYNHEKVSPMFSEKRDDENTSLSCKLVISKSNKRKYELVFENGQSLLLNRNLFKSMDFSDKHENIRRKKVQPRKQKNTIKTYVTGQISEPGTNMVNDLPQNKPINTKHENKNDCNLSKKGVTKSSEIATPAKNECIDKEIISSDTINADKSKLQNPSNVSKIPETPGLHKLPSIVSQPSYLRGIKRQVEKTR